MEAFAVIVLGDGLCQAKAVQMVRETLEQLNMSHVDLLLLGAGLPFNNIDWLILCGMF